MAATVGHYNLIFNPSAHSQHTDQCAIYTRPYTGATYFVHSMSSAIVVVRTDLNKGALEPPLRFQTEKACLKHVIRLLLLPPYANVTICNSLPADHFLFPFISPRTVSEGMHDRYTLMITDTPLMGPGIRLFCPETTISSYVTRLNILYLTHMAGSPAKTINVSLDAAFKIALDDLQMRFNPQVMLRVELPQTHPFISHLTRSESYDFGQRAPVELVIEECIEPGTNHQAFSLHCKDNAKTTIVCTACDRLPEHEYDDCRATSQVQINQLLTRKMKELEIPRDTWCDVIDMLPFAHPDKNILPATFLYNGGSPGGGIYHEDALPFRNIKFASPIQMLAKPLYPSLPVDAPPSPKCSETIDDLDWVQPPLSTVVTPPDDAPQAALADDAPPAVPPTATSELTGDSTSPFATPDACVICVDGRLEVIVLPCAHICMCASCSRALKTDRCPICHTQIETIKRFFLPHAQPPK